METLIPRKVVKSEPMFSAWAIEKASKLQCMFIASFFRDSALIFDNSRPLTFEHCLNVKEHFLIFILYDYNSLEMEEDILLLLVWTLLLIILFLLFLYTFSSSLQELWGALVTGTFGKPQVFINQQLQGQVSSFKS